VTTCRRDPSHVYPAHNKQCPWCALQNLASTPVQQTPIAPVQPAVSVPARRPANGGTLSPTPTTATSNRSGATDLRWLVLLGYIVIGASILLYFQRAAVQHSFSDTFTNGLVTFIGWVGPLPFGIGGGAVAARLWDLDLSSFFIGFGLWILAASLSIWQAFW
jgi:hypothetical protein